MTCASIGRGARILDETTNVPIAMSTTARTANNQRFNRETSSVATQGCMALPKKSVRGWMHQSCPLETMHRRRNLICYYGLARWKVSAPRLQYHCRLPRSHRLHQLLENGRLANAEQQ